MKNILLFLLLCSAFGARAQATYGVEEVPASDILPWRATSASSYEGLYHFGESEAESELALAVSGGIITAQIRAGQWRKNGTQWQWVYRTLTNVSIRGNKFYSTESTGEFVITSDGGRKMHGLKLASSTPKELPEIGGKTGAVKLYYEGQYPETSYRLLTASQLAGYDQKRLALMRNEVFARYGYTFSSNAANSAYFKKQSWYKPETNNVSAYLTTIEKRNISLLQEAEKRFSAAVSK